MACFVGQACTSLQSHLMDHLFRLVEGWAESWSAKVKMADRDRQLHTEIRELQLALLDLPSRT